MHDFTPAVHDIKPRIPYVTAKRGLCINYTYNYTVQGSRSQFFSWNPRSSVGVRKGGKTKNPLGKRKRTPMWTHTYICLASPKQEYAPDHNERITLKMAGLGEESVSLDLLAEAWEINEELCFKFPKLKKAGGYELLRLPESGGKLLDVIAMPKGGYTTSYLKAVVHHAKIYIRP